MNRKEYRAAYRAARVTRNTFTDSSGKVSREDKRAAEARWIEAVKGSMGHIYCLLGAKGNNKSLAAGALYAYRHGLYYRAESPWPEWVREKLSSQHR